MPCEHSTSIGSMCNLAHHHTLTAQDIVNNINSTIKRLEQYCDHPRRAISRHEDIELCYEYDVPLRDSVADEAYERHCRLYGDFGPRGKPIVNAAMERYWNNRYYTTAPQTYQPNPIFREVGKAALQSLRNRSSQVLKEPSYKNDLC